MRGGAILTNQKHVLITILIFIELLLITCAYVSYGNKNLDKYIFTSRDLKNSSLFAIMLEDSNGEYKQGTVTTFPGYEYFYNQEKSTCMDMSGKPVEDSLLYDQDNKKVTITIGDSSACYLYYDQYKSTLSDLIISSNKLFYSGLEEDGLRYKGTENDLYHRCGYLLEDSRLYKVTKKYYSYICNTINNNKSCSYKLSSTKTYTLNGKCPSSSNRIRYTCTSLCSGSYWGNSRLENNYICFGITDKDACTSNPDTYMYRIIGVFADENGVNHVKLIKSTQLSTSYAWHSDNTADVNWVDSDLYKGLNGSYFLTNTAYSYMQDDAWLGKIENWKWTSVNTLTNESYGPYYGNITTQNTFLHEMNRIQKTSTIGEWTTPTAKIGLMYVSDYMMSLGESSLYLTNSDSSGTYIPITLSTGWMHNSTDEWTMARYGFNGDNTSSWYVKSDGSVSYANLDSKYKARPAFYLISDIQGSGSGTETNPYIITDDVKNIILPKVTLTNIGATLTVTFTKGTGNLNKYCINTSSSITNCTWNNVTSTSINYTMPDYGTYYVHVTDDTGHIAHAYLFYNYIYPKISLHRSGSNLTINLNETSSLTKYCVTSSSTSSNCTWSTISGTSMSYTMSAYGIYYVYFIDSNNSEIKLIFSYINDKDTLTNNLINYGGLWNSNLENDGYRYVGTEITKCNYNQGIYTYYSNDVYYCPILYNYTSTYYNGSKQKYNGTYQSPMPNTSARNSYANIKQFFGTPKSSTITNNYICFGTTDKDACTSNPGIYMYRIIGVFADENGKNHVKLIKYTQLPTTYAWHSDNTVDVDWADSDLYAGLNGSYFLTNTTYSYMQDNTWLSKISDWKWSAANTKTNEDTTNNPNYKYTTGKGIYLHEMNKGTSSDTSCTNYNKTAINCLGGSWTTPTAKIGLMYASDYALSLGQAALSYTSSSNYSTLKNSWIMTTDKGASTSSYEWIMSRTGAGSSSTTYYAGAIYKSGDLFGISVSSTYSVRPVFYLTGDVKSSSGTGTLTDPYILDIS